MKTHLFSILKRCTLALAMVMLLGTSLPLAADLSVPTGKVLLTVEGKITNTNVGKTAVFDRAQLQAFGMHTVKTSNPFIEGVHTFEGILFSDLLNAVGVQGDRIAAQALDGYVVDIPVADLRKYPVLIAMVMDGKVMRVRSKGPLWVIYPVDQYEELKDETFSNRSIWQLTTLTVK